MFLVVSGCDDPTHAPAERIAGSAAAGPMIGADGAVNRFPQLADSIRELRFDPAKDPMSPEGDDPSLIEAVRRVGGRVAIGLKPVGAAPTRITGIYPAMSRAEALQRRVEIEERGARIVRTFRHSATVVVEIAPDSVVPIRKLGFVNYVAPIEVLELAQGPPVQDTSWGAKRVGAPLAWYYFSNWGQYSNITILDTGVDEDHLTAGDGDGPESVYPGDCLYVSGYFTSCYDDQPHGAHVAGIIASRNNAYGMVGIAYAPGRVASVKVCGPTAGGCPPEAVASALDWTVGNGRPRQVVNMSLGGPDDDPFIREFSLASATAGNLLIAAAGNNPNQWGVTSVYYPARYSWVMAVSGVLEDDTFPQAASFLCLNEQGAGYVGSNSGPEVEATAPFWARSMKLDGTYGIDCGTSMATPVVSAIAAMVWTRNTSWTAQQVRNRINGTAIDLWPPGRDNQFGYGRVNAYYALWDQPPTYTATIAGASEVQPYAMCSWSVSTNLPSPPLTYAWWVDGVQQSGGSEWFTWTAGTASFTLMVRVTNSQGYHVWDNHYVDVNWSAQECLDS
jgi:hypothetical protein